MKDSCGNCTIRGDYDACKAQRMDCTMFGYELWHVEALLKKHNIPKDDQLVVLRMADELKHRREAARNAVSLLR